MIKTQVLCDVCEKPFPTRIEETDFGPVECVAGFSKTKEWDTRKLFPHLCDSCALKMDSALLKFKDETTLEALINARNRKINDERKKKLGTEG